MAQILDGKVLAKKIREEVKSEVSELPFTPRLDVVLVGDDPASQIYVGGKEKACAATGITSEIHRLESSTTNDLVRLVRALNDDESVDGILVQLPLPKNINESEVLFEVSAGKDVDGFHPVNIGRMIIGERGLRPCTPSGIMRLLDEYDIDPSGKRAVVVGRSNIVGKPISLMLLERHATVTICHSRTKDLCDEVRDADIVVAAVGKPEFIRGDWIKKGAVVVDVGMNRVDDGRIKGDVEFDKANGRASFITPVPGGVGPLTIAMLLKNTLAAAQARRGQ